MQSPGDSTRLSNPSLAEHLSPRPGSALPDTSASPLGHRSTDLPWPEDLLIAFSLRMASHGMSISRIDMLGNPKYALQQLIHARDLGDPSLTRLVDELLACFPSHLVGSESLAH